MDSKLKLKLITGLVLLTAFVVSLFGPSYPVEAFFPADYVPPSYEAVPDDDVFLRTENSKTFKLDDGERRLVVSIGSIHYKDNYANPNEQWKDIDLAWEGNKITQAPYELTLEGNKITIVDKKTGGISTIELDSIGNKQVVPSQWTFSKGLARIEDYALDTDLEIVAGNSGIRFSRILKSDEAPIEAGFKVDGSIPFIVNAQDIEGELVVEATLKDGILTEALKPNQVVEYPVRIDPTWQVGASTDDCFRQLAGAVPSFSLVDTTQRAGAGAATEFEYGGGMRFTNITIHQGATINNGTHLTFVAQGGTSGACSAKISAEDVDDAVTFADSAAAFDARFANHTTAIIDWPNIPAWTDHVSYNSPELKTVIKEVVDRGGWASGQDIVIFYEDFDDRSTHAGGCYRSGHTWDGDAPNAMELVIEFTPVAIPTVTSQVATNIEDTTATGNGNITATGGQNCDIRGIVWDLASHGDPGDVAPGASGYANDVDNVGSFGTGAFTKSLTGLPTGDTIYYRAYAHNSAGYDYSNTERSFLTKPAAPTNVAATDGVHTDKVVVTWTQSTGATNYRVYEGVNDISGLLGDVATYDDVAATAGTISNAGTGDASDGTSDVHVTLSLAGEATANGTIYTYKVVASNATGNSDDSGTNTGYRGVGAITYQWQRSAADGDAGYGNIAGGTTDPYDDTGAPVFPAARWFRCIVSSTGASNSPQTSTSDRGWRALGLPVVTTQAVTNIEETTATGNGNITSTGGENADIRGFVWDLASQGAPGNVAPGASGYANDVPEAGSFGTGAFTGSLTGLPKGDLIFVRAYAHNTAGYAYGGEVNFLTKPDEPTALTATLDGSEIDLAWTKGAGAQTTYIRGKDGSYPANRADGYLVYSGAGVSVSDTEVVIGRTIYYRAWSFATEGGEDQYSDAYDQASAGPVIGDLVLHWQPITMIINQAIDRTGLGHHGDINWGENPAGIEITIGGIISATEFVPPGGGEEAEFPEVLPPPVDWNVTATNTTSVTSFFLYDLVNRAAVSLGFSASTMYVIIGLIAATGVGFGALIGAGNMLAFSIGFGTTAGLFASTGVMPWWVIIIIIMVVAMGIYSWRRG